MICSGCGGVVGRDCFNPQECVEITRSMADNFEQSNHDVQEIFYHRDRMAKALRLIASLGDTGSDEYRERFGEGIAVGWRVAEAMREIAAETVFPLEL